MLSKEQLIRLLQLVDEAIEKDETDCVKRTKDKYSSLYQMEMFDKRDNSKEELDTARKLWKFDEELREMIFGGLRYMQFQKDAMEILEKFGEEIKDLPELENNMGRILPFKKRG